MSQYMTVVDFRGSRSAYSCGYCSSKTTKYSTGMWAHSMTVEDYQRLIDRGWRRSGKYVYKPTMDKTCCPQYVIRCPVSQFKPTRSHKKVIKRNNKFFNTGVEPSKQELKECNDGDMTDQLDTGGHERTTRCDDRQNDSIKSEGSSDHSLPSSSFQVKLPSSSEPKVPNRTGEPNNDRLEPENISNQSQTCAKAQPKPGIGPDPSKPRCTKARLKRMERKQKKQGELPAIQSNTQKNNEPKPLEAFLDGIASDAVHKLEVRLVRSSPRSPEFDQTFQESFSIYKKYQIQIHRDPPDKPSEKQFTRFLVDSPLQIRLVRSWPRSEDFESTFKESHALWSQYQQKVHKELPKDCDERSYVDFLVNSPLEPLFKEGGLAHGYGSFHQQYVLDGQIIAVGVLDILPHCVSSVYLYYNPQYSFLSLGTYSALRELSFTNSLHLIDPSLQYYYMGFYIHSCPKMKYKGQFSPSYLLCPETYCWCPLEKCEPKLDACRYSRFSEMDKIDEDGVEDIREVLCLHMRQIMPYFIYQALNSGHDDSEEVGQYAKYVGLTSAKSMLLYRAAINMDDDDDDDDD